MKKCLLILFAITAISCSKDKKENPEYNKNLVGKEFYKSSTTIYNEHVEFYKSDSIRVITKFKSTGNINPYDKYKYYHWKSDGSTGTSIIVHWDGDNNFKPRDIKGIITADILTLMEYPLDGSYNIYSKK